MQKFKYPEGPAATVRRRRLEEADFAAKPEGIKEVPFLVTAAELTVRKKQRKLLRGVAKPVLPVTQQPD